MKRLILLLVSGLLILVSSAPATVDNNNNGLSDLWEQAHNNGQLFSETYDPQADPDGDGWTNAQEAAAGTDPNTPNPPDGILRPDVTHIPAVMGVDENDQPVILTPESIVISWTTLPGKQYTLLRSFDLGEESWEVFDAPFIGNGNIVEYGYPAADADKLFWRVAVSDVDTDGDGLTDAEEHELGTNPGLTDTDGDTVSDHEEIALGSDPADLDSDDDHMSNADEATAGTDMNNAEDFPPYWIIATNRAIGGTNTDGVTYGGTIRYQRWDGTAIAEKPLRDMNTDIDSAYMVAERDSAALTFPQTADEALAMEDSAQVTKALLSGGPLPSAGANFYRTVNGGSSGNYSSVRCWLRAPKKDHPQQFPFLKHVHHTRSGGGDDLNETLSCGVQDPPVIIAANQTTSDSIDLKNDTSVDAGKTHITTTSLVPVAVEDNTPATGVDATSIRAATTDIGYQGKFWIMAPSGYATDGNPCSNAVRFKIPFNQSTELNCYLPNPTPPPGVPSPVTVTLGPTPADCAWHGTSATTTETPEVDWKIGSPGQQPRVSVALPIAVKAMKRRTVKVAVWPVNASNGTIPGPFFSNPQAADDFRTSLTGQLNRIFAYQINAWFDVDLKAEVSSPYVDGKTGSNDYVIRHGTKEKDMIDAHRNTSADINIYLINHALYLSDDPSDPLSHALAGSSFPPGYSISAGYENCVVVNMSVAHTLMTMPQRQTALAHEVGHLMLGPGHPDNHKPNLENDADSVGPAPLQSLPDSEDLKRLMYSGSPNDGILLVKAEWDKAEIWLSNNVVGPNQ